MSDRQKFQAVLLVLSVLLAAATAVYDSGLLFEPEPNDLIE